MYLWKTDELAEKIRLGKMTQREYKNYYLVSCTWLFLVFFLLNAFPNPNPSVPLEFIGSVIALAISFWGVNKTYVSNGGEQGQEFLARTSALWVPIGVKLMLLSFAFYIAAGIVAAILQVPPEALESPLMNHVTGTLLLIISFWRLDVHFKRINPISE